MSSFVSHASRRASPEARVARGAARAHAVCTVRNGSCASAPRLSKRDVVAGCAGAVDRRPEGRSTTRRSVDDRTGRAARPAAPYARGMGHSQGSPPSAVSRRTIALSLARTGLALNDRHISASGFPGGRPAVTGVTTSVVPRPALDAFRQRPRHASEAARRFCPAPVRCPIALEPGVPPASPFSRMSVILLRACIARSRRRENP